MAGDKPLTKREKLAFTNLRCNSFLIWYVVKMFGHSYSIAERYIHMFKLVIWSKLERTSHKVFPQDIRQNIRKGALCNKFARNI